MATWWRRNTKCGGGGGVRWRPCLVRSSSPPPGKGGGVVGAPWLVTDLQNMWPQSATLPVLSPLLEIMLFQWVRWSDLLSFHVTPPHTWLKLYQSIKAFGPQTIYPQQLKFNIACWKALFSTPALVQHSLHLQMLLLDVYDPSVTFGSMCLRVVSVFGALPLGCTTWLHLAIWHDFEMCCIDHMLMSSRFLDEPSKLFSLG